MSDYIPFQELFFALLPVLLEEDPIPYHNSVLTGSLRYLEIMKTRNNNRFLDESRMDKRTFKRLLRKLKNEAGLKDSLHISAGEKLMIYFTPLKSNSIRATASMWQHSFSTIHHIIYEVNDCFMKIQESFFTRPSEVTPAKIANDSKLSPFFDDCMGALDGCHIPGITDDPLFRNRKGWVSQNVLGVVNFDLTFSYILAGWEGSAHDGDVLKDALNKGLIRYPQKYYLADAGYSLTWYTLTPYRGVRYHLKEWERGNARPQNYKELYNLRHMWLKELLV